MDGDGTLVSRQSSPEKIQMTITETPEYRTGFEWATEHGPLLAELFSSREVSTSELRIRLFQEATRRWPSRHDDLGNDLKQVAFVAGAFKAAVRTLPMSHEALIAMNETAMEMGSLWGAEQAKAEALQILQEKPPGWWRKKMGDASPNDVVNALASAWRHDWAKERGRPNPRSLPASQDSTAEVRSVAAPARLLFP